MTRLGLDVGITGGSVIIWTVFADTNRYKGMLTGTYTGASAEMSIAAGLGANILVGGSNRTVASRQPLSAQGQFGLDIAAGVGSLDTGTRRGKRGRCRAASNRGVTIGTRTCRRA